MRYPIPHVSPAAVIDCPVHQMTVALDDQGRIASTCPGCAKEARKARRRWSDRRRRALAVA